MDEIFFLKHKDKTSAARTGILQLAHGKVETPVFMPVGTHATVKAVPVEMLDEIGFEIILANTYHLFLRPGSNLIEKAGGLHGFSTWKRNFLTDSGGFQVFSLSKLRKITDDGVKFQSHIDGSLHFFTPENVVEAQVQFNSDIQMQLDVCSAWGESRKNAEKALIRTTDWAKRAKNRWLEKCDAGYTGKLFSIVQGNFFEDLRKKSAEFNAELDCPGIAIGGLSVGEPSEIFNEMLHFTANLLPENKPRYVMGIGTPEYIFSAVENGIDMFDCVLPTRNARNGAVFTHDGILSIKQARNFDDFSPLDSECKCKVCQQYSRAYLRHLFKSQEILFSILASYHNLYFLNNLLKEIRLAIEKDEFATFKKNFFARYNCGQNK